MAGYKEGMAFDRRVYVSADLEGVAGVVAGEELRPGNSEYETARRLMTREVNAAVRGVLAADPSVEIMVADSHGTYRNILALDLDPRASLLRGKPRHLAMVDGVREGDGVFFIGYHARAGVAGTLSHTFSDVVRDIRCNGQSLGEAGLNAAVISDVGASLLLATGNDTLAEEVDTLCPKVRTVVVSRAVSSSAAVSVHPSVACDLIEEAAQSAIEQWDGGIIHIAGPVVVDIDLAYQGQAANAALPPPVSRTSSSSVRVDAPDMIEAYRWIRAIVALAAQS